MIAILDPRPGEQILDVGCGIGDVTALMAQSGASVTGIDVLGVLLEQARMAHPSVSFVEADLLNYAPDLRFDGVYAHATLHWIQPLKDAARRVFDLLVPGGRLAATFGGACDSARQLEGYQVPTARDCEKLFKKCGFTEIEAVTEDDVLFVFARKP